MLRAIVMSHAVQADDRNPHGGLDVEALRRSLRRVAATVTVIAVKGREGAFFATTATAFAPVSFEPPTILACVNRAAVICGALAREPLFSVGILKADQAAVAVACAGGVPHEERALLFEAAARFPDVVVPRGAQASFVCRRAEVNICGTHAIILGEVLDAAHAADADPLLYLDGRYGRFRASRARPVTTETA